jgi:hypothetical protein
LVEHALIVRPPSIQRSRARRSRKRTPDQSPRRGAPPSWLPGRRIRSTRALAPVHEVGFFAQLNPARFASGVPPPLNEADIVRPANPIDCSNGARRRPISMSPPLWASTRPNSFQSWSCAEPAVRRDCLKRSARGILRFLPASIPVALRPERGLDPRTASGWCVRRRPQTRCRETRGRRYHRLESGHSSPLALPHALLPCPIGRARCLCPLVIE